MIGLDYLGKMGQLGNQMFQYAALRGIAHNNSYDFCIPSHNEVVVDVLGNRLRIELYDAFKLPHLQYKDTINSTVIQEFGFTFSEEIFMNCPDDVSLSGYFQSERYFKHIKEEIKEDFTFRSEITAECRDFIGTCDGAIALHIRRGDFLRNSGNHHNLSLDYYEEALSKFDDDRKVIIFTDDPKWAFKQELFGPKRFYLSDMNGPYHDMFLMSRCSDFIIANSTFSWWGAWLADKGKVIAPKKWFGPNNSHLNTEDLYPDQWEVI